MKINTTLKEKILFTEEKNWKGVHPVSEFRKDPELKLQARVDEFSGIVDMLDSDMGLSSKKILNIGCGFGYFELVAKERGYDFIAIDPDLNEIVIASNLVDDGENSHFLQSVGEKLPLKGGSIDRIVSFSVFEHVHSISEVLDECFRVLGSEGRIFVGAPNYLKFREGHYKIWFFPCMWRPLAKIYLILRGKNPGFLNSINYVTPNSIRKSLIDAGFEIISDPVEKALSKLESFSIKTEDLNIIKKLAGLPPFKAIIKFWIKRGFFIPNAFVGQKTKN